MTGLFFVPEAHQHIEIKLSKCALGVIRISYVYSSAAMKVYYIDYSQLHFFLSAIFLVKLFLFTYGK